MGVQFLKIGLRAACNTVQESNGDEVRLHRIGAAWCSHSVLAEALQRVVPPSWRMLARPFLRDQWSLFMDNPDVVGAVVNVANSHWTVLVEHATLGWYVDSQYLPVIITEMDCHDIVSRNPITCLVVVNASNLG